MTCVRQPQYSSRRAPVSTSNRKRHTDIYLIRHGETDSNVNGLLHGITDVPLNDKGLRQAELIGRRMAEIPHLDRIVTSPLQRARRTAEAIVAYSGLPLEVDDALSEMNFGEAEGLPYHEIGEVYPEQSRRFLDTQDRDVRYPRGESRGEFFQRVQLAIDDIATRYLGQDVVVVSHSGFISAALALIIKEHPNNWRERPIHNCSLTHIELATSGAIAHIVNDIVHLEQLVIEEEGIVKEAR